jgi:hypothetical protein
VLPLLREQVAAAEALVASWAQDKPWISEDESTKASDKVGVVCVCVGGC